MTFHAHRIQSQDKTYEEAQKNNYANPKGQRSESEKRVSKAVNFLKRCNTINIKQCQVIKQLQTRAIDGICRKSQKHRFTKQSIDKGMDFRSNQTYRVLEELTAEIKTDLESKYR